MEQKFNLELRNGVGQVLFNKKLPSHTLKFELSLQTFKPGFYLITIQDENNAPQSKK